jgi:hypothetical protein
MTDRPHLTIVHGGKLDAVERRQLFERGHPEVTFVPPGTEYDSWRAVVPAGTIPGDLTATTLGAYELSGLMDQLDKLYPPACGNPGQMQR